jgi:hypothetical protein
MRPRCGALVDERRVVVRDECEVNLSVGQAAANKRVYVAATRHARPRRAVGHRRARASLVASFAAGVAGWTFSFGGATAATNSSSVDLRVQSVELPSRLTFPPSTFILHSGKPSSWQTARSPD